MEMREEPSFFFKRVDDFCNWTSAICIIVVSKCKNITFMRVCREKNRMNKRKTNIQWHIKPSFITITEERKTLLVVTYQDRKSVV